MNRYLDEATRNAIEEKNLRFDDRELRGKTIARSVYGTVTGISFTDGTWCAVDAEADSDGGAGCTHVFHLDLYDLRALGLITEEQFATAHAKELDQKREWKQKQIKQLQSELESGR